MKIYLDFVLLLNFFFDFLLLLGTSLLLRRRVKIYRVILGGLFGSLSIFILFIKMTSAQLFFLKIIISIVMVIVTFNYCNIKYTFKNTIFLYTLGIILGGFIYYLNMEFSYKQKGLVFYHNGISINIIMLLILTPIILYLYIKEGKSLKNNYNNYYPLTIKVKNITIKASGYMDTGNKLIEPYTSKPVILYHPDNDIKWDNLPFIYIPYRGVDGQGIIRCVKIDELSIDNKRIKNIYLGLMKDKINIDGIDCILNIKLWEG